MFGEESKVSFDSFFFTYDVNGIVLQIGQQFNK